MKKGTSKIILVVLLTVIFLQGCTEINMDTGEIIVPPKNNNISIEGTWKITYDKLFGDKTYRKERGNIHFGKTVIFNEEALVFGEEVFYGPKFKMKKVDSRDYFLHEYKINFRELGIIGRTVEVVSVTSKDKHIYDFIRVSEKRLLVYIDHVFYYLDKISEDTEKVITGKEGSVNAIQNNNEAAIAKKPYTIKSGILLGLRAPISVHNGIPQESYRTLWIASQDKEIYSVMESSDILLPRKSGFWLLGIKRHYYDNRDLFEDRLFAYPLKETVNSIIEKNKGLAFKNKELHHEKDIRLRANNITENLYKSISFAGNDYAAIESYRYFDPKAVKLKEVNIVPIDNIENEKGVSINELSGADSDLALINSAQAQIVTLGKWEAEQLEKDIRLDSISLSRRNGHWIMKGRLYYKNPVMNYHHVDYNINIMPPEKLVNYDNLALSWNQIKTRVPEALDAYTSPNKDIAIIKTDQYIYVYSINKGELSNHYLKRIAAREEETIVMAEWAIGNYVDKWDNAVDDRSKVIEY